MQNSKLIFTLQALSPKELKRLHQFLKSPFFNANKSIVSCYLILSNYSPTFNSPNISKEKVFKKIFPERAYDHQKMLNLMSDFNSLLEKYLCQLQLEKENISQHRLLLNAYSHRPKCYERFEKQFIYLNRVMDEMPFRDEIYYFEKMALQLHYYNHPGTDQLLDSNNALFLADQYFNIYQDITAKKIKCATNARDNAVSSKKAIKLNAEESKQENPVIKLYEKLNTLQQPDSSPKDLNNLIHYFIDYLHLLRSEDNSNILKILLNYCNRMINRGEKEYWQTSLNLYKIGLEKNLLFTYGKLTGYTFQNIVTIGTICGEFGWTKKFMESFENQLDEHIRKDAMTMGMAQWHLIKGEQLKAIGILNHSFKEPHDIFKGKSLLIRAWFELYWQDDQYSSMLISHLEAFEKYARRDKFISARLKEAYLKFILLTKKLTIHKWDKKAIKKINREILKQPNLLLKNWLLEKSR